MNVRSLFRKVSVNKLIQVPIKVLISPRAAGMNMISSEDSNFRRLVPLSMIRLRNGRFVYKFAAKG